MSDAGQGAVRLSWAEILEKLDELEKRLNELKGEKTEALI